MRRITHTIERLVAIGPAVLLAAVVACGSDDRPTDPDRGTPGAQGLNTVVSPASATVARGATTNITVTFTTFGGVTFNSLTISRQFNGIGVTQTSTQTSGQTTTRAYAIRADETVPAGTHDVRFVPSISGATTTPTVNSGTFVLTVTP